MPHNHNHNHNQDQLLRLKQARAASPKHNDRCTSCPLQTHGSIYLILERLWRKLCEVRACCSSEKSHEKGHALMHYAAGAVQVDAARCHQPHHMRDAGKQLHHLLVIIAIWDWRQHLANLPEIYLRTPPSPCISCMLSRNSLALLSAMTCNIAGFNVCTHAACCDSEHLHFMQSAFC